MRVVYGPIIDWFDVIELFLLRSYTVKYFKPPFLRFLDQKLDLLDRKKYVKFYFFFKLNIWYPFRKFEIGLNVNFFS